MKFYTTKISGRLLLQICSEGIISDFDEKIVNETGVPQGGHVIATRWDDGMGWLEILFVTTEDGEVPEAVDMWSYAEQITPTQTVEYREKAEFEPPKLTKIGKANETV